MIGLVYCIVGLEKVLHCDNLILFFNKLGLDRSWVREFHSNLLWFVLVGIRADLITGSFIS